MALTNTILRSGVVGDLRYVIADVDFDSSYPTGGESLTASDLGFQGGKIEFLIAEDTSGYLFEFDHTNKLLIARQGDNDNAADAPAVQVPNATNLSAVVDVRVFALISGV